MSLSELLLIAAVVLAAQIGTLDRAAASDRPKHDFDAARNYIEQRITKDPLPSVTVAAARDGKIIWEEAFGWADRERRIPATVHTPYAIASVTKPMTATALMTLVEQGKVQLDRPVDDYLGSAKLTGLAGDTKAATVRRVLTHTSGLPLHYHFFFDDDGEPVPPIEQTISRYAILVHPPGEVYDYSNLGYGVLGSVIERVSGDSYADYMKRAVFVPLGMTRSSIGIPAHLEDEVAVMYDSRGQRVSHYRTDHPAASAAYASVHDLIRFGMLHLKNRIAGQQRILTDETVDAMQAGVRPPRGALEAPETRGLGWGMANVGQRYEVIRHFGSMHGVLAVLALYPRENVAVAVLTNTEGDHKAVVGAIADQIARVAMPGYPGAVLAEDKRAFSLPADLLGEWRGSLRTWSGTVPLQMSIRQGHDIELRLADQPAAALKHPRFDDGTLTGEFAATIPTADAAKQSHSVFLAVHLRDRTLRGPASAVASRDEFALTAYVKLEKVSR